MRPGAMVNANGLGAVSPNKGLRQDAGLVIVNNSICDLKKKNFIAFSLKCLIITRMPALILIGDAVKRTLRLLS